MRPRVKSALLWGAVGFMSFLVLVQGYALLSGPLVTIGQGAALAVAVGTVTTGCAYTVEHRVAQWATARALEAEATESETESRKS